jgi:hypothetical protein
MRITTQRKALNLEKQRESSGDEIYYRYSTVHKMFRSAGWKMATGGLVPWEEDSGAGDRYIIYFL